MMVNIDVQFDKFCSVQQQLFIASEMFLFLFLFSISFDIDLFAWFVVVFCFELVGKGWKEHTQMH